MKQVLIIAAVILVLIFASAIGIRNKIVTLDENVSAAWAQVETVLQRRFDLIPNLVNTVKGYAAHERGVFEEVTRLRSQWGAAKNAEERVATANQMEGALGRLLLVAENYPELKANQNFLALQDELAGTENRIAVERRRYNEAVQIFNTYIRRFPASMMAGFMGMERKTAYFEASPEAKSAPVVQF